MRSFIHCATDSASSLMFTADSMKTFQSVHSKAPCSLVMTSAVQFLTSTVLGLICLAIGRYLGLMKTRLWSDSPKFAI